MPRYFFYLRDGEYESQDEEGPVLDGLKEVMAYALMTLPDIAREKLPKGHEREFVIEAKDESGRSVLRARLSLTVETLVEA